MTIQSSINNESLSLFPEIMELVSQAGEFAANQIRNKAIAMISCSHPTVYEMGTRELKGFELAMIEIFKFKDWVAK